MIAMIATIVAVVAFLASLGFNYLQHKWREEDRKAHEREHEEDRAEHAREIKEVRDQQSREEAERLTKERALPEFLQDGVRNRIQLTGRQPFSTLVDLWGTITVVNPTQSPMTITPLRLSVNGADWVVQRFAFHLKTDDRDRNGSIHGLPGNLSRDYNLHIHFPADKYPLGKSGELWLTSSNREDEPFSISISFA